MTTPITALTSQISSLRNASAAYGGSAIGGLSLSNGPRPTVAPAADFGSMVTNAAHAAINTLHRSEHVTALGVAGKADVQDVVQAASDAEMTAQTVVSLRDKILGAYNDVMRMSI